MVLDLQPWPAPLYNSVIQLNVATSLMRVSKEYEVYLPKYESFTISHSSRATFLPLETISISGVSAMSRMRLGDAHSKTFMCQRSCNVRGTQLPATMIGRKGGTALEETAPRKFYTVNFPTDGRIPICFIL